MPSSSHHHSIVFTTTIPLHCTTTLTTNNHVITLTTQSLTTIILTTTPSVAPSSWHYYPQHHNILLPSPPYHQSNWLNYSHQKPSVTWNQYPHHQTIRLTFSIKLSIQPPLAAYPTAHHSPEHTMVTTTFLISATTTPWKAVSAWEMTREWTSSVFTDAAPWTWTGIFKSQAEKEWAVLTIAWGPWALSLNFLHPVHLLKAVWCPSCPHFAEDMKVARS